MLVDCGFNSIDPEFFPEDVELHLIMEYWPLGMEKWMGRNIIRLKTRGELDGDRRDSFIC